MNRNLISFEALLSAAANQFGYAPYYCSAQSIIPKVQSMPVVVIYPSEVVEKEGINRCRITSRIEFLVVKNGVSLSQEQKMQMLSDMRLDILKMVNLVEMNVSVVNVTGLEIVVDEKPLMHSDDLQLHATMEVVSNFTHSTQMEEEE